MSGELTPEQRARLETLFDRASELALDEQRAFLDQECGTSGPLREHLARLLAGLGGEDLLGEARAAPPSRAGTQIGSYKLLERIGDGGMGEVYEAEQREPIVRRVALKIIKPGMDSTQVIARFEAERQALARMSHPNIAQVFDGGTMASGSPYFVMEYVPGAPITEYCDQRKLSTRARLELFLDVCEGVQHAHQKGIIHRDLKPSNILVLEQDGRALPKIIDFGVARAVTGRLVDRTLHTLMGQIVGTLNYMSPEQADPSSSDIDTRSDIYSLGVVLYQVLSGLLPFEYHLSADLPLSYIQRSIREKDPPTPSTRLRRERGTATRLAPLHGTDERSLVRQLTGDLDWICLKALEKDPARRYASASELAEDLRRHLRHEPVLAGRPGRLYRASKFVRRNRLGVTSATLLVLALASGAFGLFRQLAGARVEAAFSYASALQQVEAQVQRADELWPVTADRIDDYERWIEAAHALRGPLEDYRAELVQIEARTHSGSGLSGAERQRHEWLTSLVDTLGSWDDEVRGLLAPMGVSPEHGWSVPRRLDFAREMQAREQDPRFAAQWQEARDAIHAEPRYDRLELGLQRGLLPLGPDPISRLHEFAVLGSGEPPRRDPKTRELVFEEGSGIVLVLIPCGGFFMGTQHSSPDGPNYLAEPTFMESVRRSPSQRRPVNGIEPADDGAALWVPDLPAFFISKFEMTGAQWILANGPIPERDFIGVGVYARFPIDLVTALECDLALGRLGLVLPNEVQWERAARAGTTTPWWTGPDEGSLRGAENILDASSVARFKAWGQGMRRTAAAWNDGEPGFGEVGLRDKRRANPFGLWDVLGNVTEWCSNAPFVLGNPLPGPEAAQTERMARGGSSRLDPFFCRASMRGFMNNPGFRLPALGLRPAREIDP